ncbi:MAG: L-threonylcarbamoyladenylate synthase [Halanaerobiaceae bacterium]
MTNISTKLYKIDNKKIEEKNINSLKNDSIIREAALLLKNGELVAFPTETVYGLGADATNENAVRKIYTAKGRPQDNPLIVHISNIEQLKNVMSGRLSKVAQKLISHFWPGPLTIIVKKSSNIPDQTTAGMDSVAVRMPAHPLSHALIEAANLPIAAPSANRSGAPSPTRAEHVMDDLSGKIPLILDGGPSSVGVESTVVDVRTGLKILRPGGISLEEIQEIIGDIPVYDTESDHIFADDNTKPLSPGMKYKHYSPDTSLSIIDRDIDIKKFIAEQNNNNIGFILTEETIREIDFQLNNVKIFNMGSGNNPHEIASNLYDVLRKIDKVSVNNAFIESISEKGIGKAVMNRIYKASIKE